jgi:anti-sigma factor RsiW
MKHESMRQLLALNLYGELESSERERLTRHLEECDDCRRFEAQLGDGLGACLARPADAGELPADWSRRLGLVTSSSPAAPARKARSLPWWTAAAGFAACWFLLSALGWAPRAQDAPRFSSEPELARFSRATAPPLAQSSGGLRQWLEMRK